MDFGAAMFFTDYSMTPADLGQVLKRERRPPQLDVDGAQAPGGQLAATVAERQAEARGRERPAQLMTGPRHRGHALAQHAPDGHQQRDGDPSRDPARERAERAHRWGTESISR